MNANEKADEIKDLLGLSEDERDMVGSIIEGI